MGRCLKSNVLRTAEILERTNEISIALRSLSLARKIKKPL